MFSMFSQANHRDMDEHRLVQTEEAVAFIEHLERQVKYFYHYLRIFNDTSLEPWLSDHCLIAWLRQSEQKLVQSFSLLQISSLIQPSINTYM